MVILTVQISCGSRLNELLENKEDLARIRLILQPYIAKKKMETQMQRKTDVVRIRRPHYQSSLPSNIIPSTVRFPHFPQVHGGPTKNTPRYVRNSISSFQKPSTKVEPFGDFLIESDNPSSTPYFDSEKLLADFAKDDLFHFKDNAKDYLFKFTFASKNADDNIKVKQPVFDPKQKFSEATTKKPATISLTIDPVETTSMKTSTALPITTAKSASTTSSIPTTTFKPNTTTPFHMIKEIFEQEDLPEDKEYITPAQLDDYMIILPLPFKFLKKDSPLLDQLG